MALFFPLHIQTFWHHELLNKKKKKKWNYIPIFCDMPLLFRYINHQKIKIKTINFHKKKILYTKKPLHFHHIYFILG